MTTLGQRIEVIRLDEEHGASWLSRHAVEALVAAAEQADGDTDAFLAQLTEAGRRLAATRPGVGAVAAAVGRVVGAAHSAGRLEPDELRRLVRREATALVERRRRAGAAIAIQLADRVRDAFVLTISASSTVREAVTRTPPYRVGCVHTGPYGEGEHLAHELRAQGIDARVISDDGAAAALEGATVFLLGADTVFRDGAVCNKAGTLRLAEAAARLGVPVVVASESAKFAPVGSGEAPPLEGDAGFFEVVPPELVGEIVTEDGSFAPATVHEAVDRTPFLAAGWALLERAAGPAG